MATPKKKHLIELMIEEGVEWQDGAAYAAQDKRDGRLYFFEMKPYVTPGYEHYCAPGGPMVYSCLLPSICRNWHQTIVTREQYAEAVAAVNSEQKPQYCASVMRQMPDNTIEQLTSDYHAKAAEADRLQSVADEALKAADDALLALEKAGELLGLVISIDTKPAQPDITDWRDLRIGDVVECVDYESDKKGVIIGIDREDEDQPINVNRYMSGVAWPFSWRFIRRP